jgi:surface antigen
LLANQQQKERAQMGASHNAVRLVASIGLALSVAGCEGMGQHEQEMTAFGCAAGALGGGLIGLVAGHGNGGAVAAGAGAGLLTGCVAGNVIGRQLDERDRGAAEAATLAALNAPSSSRSVARAWRSDHGTGNHGTVVVQSTTRMASGSECKEVNEVAYIQSKEVAQPAKYCRSGASGDWKQA